MGKLLIIITALQVFATACSEDLKIKTVGSRTPTMSEESCDKRPETPGCSDFLDGLAKKRLFKLDQLSAINSYQDYIVRLYGSAFDNNLKITIEGQDVPVFKISETEAFFITPSFDSPGMKIAVLKKLDVSIEFKLFILADRSINPESLTEASELCEGTEFMAADGSIALGTKNCANVASGKNCSKDGEVGCMTTDSFTATDIKSAANKILAGEIVGGVEGKVALPAASKVLNGEVFGAADQALSGTLTLPGPAFVRTTFGPYGVGGNGSSPALADCSSDGAAGCVAVGPSFAAAIITGASSKILSGQVLAGISGHVVLPNASYVLQSTSYGAAAAAMVGTLSLPAASKVLTGISYGTAGSGSSGTLTLPASAHVLMGSGAYGDPSAPLTPAYSPDFPALANVRASATVNGQAGTLADCSMANQTTCVATSVYKTMNLTVSGSDNGLTSANFNSTIKSAGNFEFWDAAGQRHSVAGDIDLATANIKIGISIFGIDGGLTGAPANCSSDGQANCLVDGGNFAAGAIIGAASKILSGQTMAGVSGNVTLPAANKVLTGNSFGVSGTTLSGSLTLPSAQNVLAGSGAYGDSLATATPTLTLPAAGKVLNGTAYGVAATGSTGTLTLPSAGSVLSTHGNYGDAGALTTPTLTLPAAGKVLSGTSYGASGNGSSGALTLPTAGHVLAGSGTYGDTAALIMPTLTLPAVGKVLTATAYGVAGTGSMGTLTLPAAGAVRSNGGAYGDPGSAVIGTISDCAANGSACYVPSYALTTQPLKAISYDAINTGKASIRSSLTVGGVTGTLLDCTDGDFACYVVGPSFMAAAVNAGTSNKILAGQTVAGVSGNVTLPAVNKVLAGHSFGVSGTGLSGSLTLPSAQNVLAGSAAYGDSLATVTPTLTLPAVGKVLSGTTYGVAATGSAGTLTLPSAGYVLSTHGSYGDTAALMTPTLTLPAVGKVLTATAYGVAGTGSTGTLTLPAAGNVLSSAGNYGDASALTAPTLALPAAGKVLSGTSYGVSGSGSTGTLSLPAAGAVRSSAGTYGDPGSAVTGTIGDCAANGSACYVPSYIVTTQPLKAISYDAIDAGKASMRTSLTLSGIVGTLANCSTNAATGCVTTASYQSANLTNLAAGNIKRGISLAGITGNFPSATSPIPRYTDSGATAATGGTDINDLTTFITQLVTDGAFEYWDSTGIRRTGSGDNDITAANIKNTVAFENLSITGSFGPNCTGDGQTDCLTTATYKSLNTSALTGWDIRRGKSAGGIAGKIFWEKGGSVEDNNAGGSVPSQDADSYGLNNWTLVTGYSAYKDELTGLTWRYDTASTSTPATASSTCNGLTYANRSDWRLPTIKEYMQAYINGIWRVRSTLSLVLNPSYSYWSSTIDQTGGGGGNWHMTMGSPIIENYFNTFSSRYLCVAP